MGTHAIVALKTNDGYYKTAYIQYDGYIEYTGQCLVKYWNTEEKVNTLINYGGMRILKATEELMEHECYHNEEVETCYTMAGLLSKVKRHFAHLYIFENGKWNIENKWQEDTFNFHEKTFLANKVYQDIKSKNEENNICSKDLTNSIEEKIKIKNEERKFKP